MSLPCPPKRSEGGCVKSATWAFHPFIIVLIVVPAYPTRNNH
jgi:hypothetical protein